MQVFLVNTDKTKLGAPVDEVQEQDDSGDGDAGQVDDILVDLEKYRVSLFCYWLGTKTISGHPITIKPPLQCH